MQHVDEALLRLETALCDLETVLEEAATRVSAAGGAAAERDRLAREVETLREAAKRDEILRAEAAEAVKAALGDLRALMPEDRPHG